ncbi:hypothetical protein BR93DRAFT_968396 [Coniochaeta sp. PMI_546]|nr:hypothetical protein BR93DRAFT_968396 [Coniochaeta sp. PMI_546]
MAPVNEHEVAVVPGAIQKSATPWLTAAPGLVHSLGVCTALASTPQVACITLTRPGLESTDLSTNLVHIADQGQNAFMDAYTDLLDISNGTRAMSRDNGYFDRLEEAIGKPEGERSAERAMERITQTIRECDKNGKHTENQFKQWHQTVKSVRLAVIETQKTTQAGSRHVAEKIRELNDQHTLQETPLHGLAGLESDKEQLERMAGIIVVVCRILQGLCADIVQLVRMFAHLNATIRQLIADYKGAKDIASSIREDLEDAEDEGTEARISKRDYDQFRDQVHEMRRLTVMINSMSTLYADVITDVITPGFSKVVETAYEDYGETKMSVIMYNKEKGMKDYLLGAEKVCHEREKEADGKLKTRLEEIEVAFEARTTSKHSRPKFKKESSSGSSRRSQGSFFSRMFNRD